MNINLFEKIFAQSKYFYIFVVSKCNNMKNIKKDTKKKVNLGSGKFSLNQTIKCMNTHYDRNGLELWETYSVLGFKGSSKTHIILNDGKAHNEKRFMNLQSARNVVIDSILD